jgi:molybdate transport system substrate-binding protein
MNMRFTEKYRRACTALLLFATWSFSFAARAQNPAPTVLKVAAAADLKFAMSDLAAQFEKKTGTKVDVTYGSSGNFFSQIQNGAPFDVFFSADLDYAKKIETLNLAEPQSLWKYAVGRLVLWTPAETKVDVTRDGWTALLDPRVEKIAIANPSHAPYGKAAVAALESAGIYEQVKNKLVYGENISQAAQFVESGNAQAGLLALSLVVAPAMKNGHAWIIPAGAYPPIEQGVVILRSSQNKAAARSFLDFVRSNAGAATLQQYGFTLPDLEKPRGTHKQR